ncbi:carbohydrate kinase family protein [Candidatus Saccharibacteria bacterium]|nr:carbohydrate kinase family protein [Candidatus Saccharibacteria bacterium]
MTHRIDVLAVGDIVSDTFIKLLDKEAEVDKDPIDKHPLLCMTYGTKVPFEYAIDIHGVGNSANAAVSCARLGLRAALYSNIGKDELGRKMLAAMKQNKVQTQYIHDHAGKVSNLHYVLWYEPDRTILIKHEQYDVSWPKIPKEDTPKWIYLSSIGENELHLQEDIADYLEKNPEVQLAFQPGTFQMRLGFKKLARLMKQTDVFAVNKEEAQMMTGLKTNSIPELMQAIHDEGAGIVVITDGPNGSYASDGKRVLAMRSYPDPKPPFERTGAGDAFTSTFVAAIIKTGDIETALKWGPINSMSVVQKVGAQAGLLTESALLKLLKDAPKNYEPKEM